MTQVMCLEVVSQPRDFPIEDNAGVRGGAHPRTELAKPQTAHSSQGVQRDREKEHTTGDEIFD